MNQIHKKLLTFLFAVILLASPKIFSGTCTSNTSNQFHLSPGAILVMDTGGNASVTQNTTQPPAADDDDIPEIPENFEAAVDALISARAASTRSSSSGRSADFSHVTPVSPSGFVSPETAERRERRRARSEAAASKRAHDAKCASSGRKELSRSADSNPAHRYSNLEAAYSPEGGLPGSVPERVDGAGTGSADGSAAPRTRRGHYQADPKIHQQAIIDAHETRQTDIEKILKSIGRLTTPQLFRNYLHQISVRAQGILSDNRSFVSSASAGASAESRAIEYAQFDISAAAAALEEFDTNPSHWKEVRKNLSTSYTSHMVEVSDQQTLAVTSYFSH